MQPGRLRPTVAYDLSRADMVYEQFGDAADLVRRGRS